MAPNDYLIKEEETNPIGWKSIGRLLPRYEKTIAKAFGLHDGIRMHEIRVLEVIG